MPTPGSHAYDRERQRLRRHLEGEGAFDEDAEKQAARTMASRSRPNVAARSDRARGPLGERPSARGGGDPGAVLQLRSPAFSDNAMIPPKLTQAGENLSPALEWSPAPPGTAEIALLCEDRDAPGGVVTHWLVTGIDPGVTSIAEGESPSGAVVWPNSFGNRGYDGPMPPIGDDPHRYFFRLFALEEPTALPPHATIDEVHEVLEDRHVATGTLIGLFAR